MSEKLYKVLFSEAKRDHRPVSSPTTYRIRALYSECDIYSAEDTLLGPCTFRISYTRLVLEWGFQEADASAVLARCALEILKKELSKGIPTGDIVVDTELNTKPRLSGQKIYSIQEQLQQRIPFELRVQTPIGFRP